MKTVCHRILLLTGMVLVLVLATCTKLPTDLTESDRINTYDRAGLFMTWIKCYGGTGIDYLSNFDTTTDGGYIFTGSTNSYGAGDKDIYLVKTNSNGEIEWYKTYGGSKDDNGNYVKQTYDGGYIVVGDSRSGGYGYSDLYIIKSDVYGNKLWEKFYGGYAGDYGNGVVQLSDSNYLITGVTNSFTYTGYLLKVKDEDGDTIWTKFYSGQGYEVKPTNDSNFIVAGKLSLSKINSSGNVIWTASTWGSSVVQGNDNNFYTAYDNYIACVSPNGIIEWTKQFTDTVYYKAQSINKANDGMLIITGYRLPDWDVFFAKLSTAGNIKFLINFKGAGSGCYIVQKADNSYIIGGRTNTNDAFIIKTKPENNWK